MKTGNAKLSSGQDKGMKEAANGDNTTICGVACKAANLKAGMKASTQNYILRKN